MSLVCEPTCRPAAPEPEAPSPARGSGLALAAAVGLLVTAAQLLLALAMTGEHDRGAAYLALQRWDGGWYWTIVEQGYHSPAVPTATAYGNVGFFPGYPTAARLVKWAFGLDGRVALLVTSQLSCWAFWTYLLLLARRWGVPAGWSALGVLAIACHPAAFYLVAAYSESLLLASFLGFVYWSERPGPAAAALAAAHGVVMTATRLVGLPLVIYPLLRAWLRPDAARPTDLRDLVRRSAVPLLVGAVASLGALGYFAYCQYRFGHWDLYARTQEAGWGMRADYLALFRPKLWSTVGVSPLEPFTNRLTAHLLLLVFAAVPVVEWWLARRRETGWRERLPLLYCAGVLFYIPVCAYLSVNLASLVRYALCVQVPLVLLLLHLVTSLGTPSLPRWGKLAVALALTGSLLVQMLLTNRFTNWVWVA